MARNIFPNERFVAGILRGSTLLRIVDGMTLQVYVDQACTSLADIVDLGLNPISTISVTDSQIDRFYGPDDDTRTLYVRLSDMAGDGDAIYAYGVAAGTPGAADSYVHYQSVPSAEWTIDHSLGFPPSVTIVNSAGEKVEANVSFPPDAITTQVVVAFSGALAGRAYLS